MTKINNPESVEVSLTGDARDVVAMLWGEGFSTEIAQRLTEGLRDSLTDDLCPGGEGYCSPRCRRLCGLAR